MRHKWTHPIPFFLYFFISVTHSQNPLSTSQGSGNGQTQEGQAPSGMSSQSFQSSQSSQSQMSETVVFRMSEPIGNGTVNSNNNNNMGNNNPILPPSPGSQSRSLVNLNTDFIDDNDEEEDDRFGRFNSFDNRGRVVSSKTTKSSKSSSPNSKSSSTSTKNQSKPSKASTTTQKIPSNKSRKPKPKPKPKSSSSESDSDENKAKVPGAVESDSVEKLRQRANKYGRAFNGGPKGNKKRKKKKKISSESSSSESDSKSKESGKNGTKPTPVVLDSVEILRQNLLKYQSTGNKRKKSGKKGRTVWDGPQTADPYAHLSQNSTVIPTVDKQLEKINLKLDIMIEGQRIIRSYLKKLKDKTRSSRD